MSSLIIRKATMDDIPAIPNVHRNYEGPWNDPEECAAWISKRLERGFYIQLAELDGKIVGHGEWIVSDEPHEKYLYLGMLQIDDTFQKRGIGRKMIDDGIRFAQEQGCEKIVTFPDTDTGSEVFYEKCGFINGRKLVATTLSSQKNEYSQEYTAINSVPFSTIAEKKFVLGLAQISSRHMWECYNQKPVTDDRTTATLLSPSGDCIQLGWFSKDDPVLALLWSNSPSHDMVLDILTFANENGLKDVTFRFFPENIWLFDNFYIEIVEEDTEIWRLL